MTGSGRHKTKQRYARYLQEAHQAALATLECSAPVRLTTITPAALDRWAADWVPINARRQPDGGWDWRAIRELYGKDDKRF